MYSINNCLYLFTATYPYGKAESFLDDELPILCQFFKKVVIVPLSGRSGLRKRIVPCNCEVLIPIIRSKAGQYIKGLLFPKSFSVYAKDFFVKKVWCNYRRFKTWLISYVITNNLLNSKKIKRIFEAIQPNDICYFYWGKGANTLAYFYRGKCHFVSRFHGEWDLWEESSGDYAPIRQMVVENLDYAVFISKKGECYFKQRYPNIRTIVQPLGSIDYGERPRSKVDVLRVISCSAVYPLKRVPLIYEAVKSIKCCKVQWTHIGGGTDLEKLKTLVAQNDNPNLTICLLGSKNHNEVMSYYQNHTEDVFVNVSTNEGVPVSIMEALSFGIPVVATDVGSSSEIVTEDSGILIGANPLPEEVADAIIAIGERQLNPRAFWQQHYSAAVNYKSFVSFLKGLK